ncbi:MAG: 2-C-methyl-D-erythritol 4-phosphate cytidylyltransferase [Lachnospiraceae bacterium]|jgi:2-C-methyl-D-erythritol 4-phosphate cytidylyltransferase
MAKSAAIVLAAGQGKRMQSHVQKQFLLLNDRPLITYALEAFENSPVDQIILVTGSDEIRYCRDEIAEKYGFSKVTKVIAGGRERYHSVYEGLKAVEGAEYVLIHDGARPLLNQEIISRALEGAKEYGACVVGMPVKDTIKASGADGFVASTPDRSTLWQIQTPQAFFYPWIFQAYEKLFSREEYQQGVTDDAMVLEAMTSHKVKLIEGSYFNIKVTTPEDMAVAEALLKFESCSKK